MAGGLWLWILCIIIEETLHEDVVGLMWHGQRPVAGHFVNFRGVIKDKEFAHHKYLTSQDYFCWSYIVISDIHKC